MSLLSIITLKTKLLLRFGWYRIWSDKWIEQGSITNVGGAGDHNISLLKSVKLGRCLVSIGGTSTGIPNGHWQNGNWVSGSNLNYYLSGGSNVHLVWYIFGY